MPGAQASGIFVSDQGREDITPDEVSSCWKGEML